MATTFKFADLPVWAKKVQKITDKVVSQATNDLLVSIKVDGGKNRGGAQVRGAIPMDLGTLAGSLQSTLYGSTSLTQEGEESFKLVAGDMQAGDVARFAWGGAAAPYAARIHYGFSGEDSLGRTYNSTGTFWIDDAASRWVPTVNAAVAKVRAELG